MVSKSSYYETEKVNGKQVSEEKALESRGGDSTRKEMSLKISPKKSDKVNQFLEDGTSLHNLHGQGLDCKRVVEIPTFM